MGKQHKDGFSLDELASEKWKPVVGYEGLYEVSDLGRVKTLGRTIVYDDGNSRTLKPRILKQIPNRKRDNTLFVGLHKEKTQHNRKVSHITLEAFEGPRPKGLEACHNDGNNQNNRRTNLRWDTHQNNMADMKKHGTFSPPPENDNRGSRNGRAVLTEGDIPTIRRLLQNGMFMREIGRMFGVSYKTISDIKRGKAWKHVK